MTYHDWQKGMLAVLAYFQKRTADKQPKRKPTWALRLLTEDGERVILKPRWNRKDKKIQPDLLEFEVWEWATILGTRHHRKKGWGALWLKKDYADKKKSDALLKVFAVLDAFYKDHKKVTGRRSNQCACCDRPLKDETSMARGVGPECMKHFRMFDEIIRNMGD